MTLPSLLILLGCVAVEPSGQPDAPVRVSVEVGFVEAGWRLSVTSEGQVIGDIEDARFSAASLPAETLSRIRGLARCVVAVPAPAFPGPPIIDTAEPMGPLVVLKVRAEATSREIWFGKDTLTGPGVEDAWPAINLLILIRGLVPGAEAHDYRGWLRDSVRRSEEPRCPWLAALMEE